MFNLKIEIFKNLESMFHLELQEDHLTILKYMGNSDQIQDLQHKTLIFRVLIFGKMVKVSL